MEELNINPPDATLSGWLKVEFIDIDLVTASSVTASGAHVALLSGNNFTPNLTFNSMTHRRFILRLTDNNHQRFIAGCKDDPLRFSYSSSDSGTPADGAAYTLTFSGLSRLPLLPER